MEEEKSNAQRLQDQINSLNTKIRNLKRDKEEAESESEGLQRRLRQAKSALEDAEDQISTLQSQVAKSRGAGRKPKVRQQPYFVARNFQSKNIDIPNYSIIIVLVIFRPF